MLRFALPTLLLAAALALPTAGCSQESASERAFGERVRAYIVQHPEVIEEAMNRLAANRQATVDRDAQHALAENRQSLERDPGDFVANPNGKITVIEFFDYKCTYCKLSAPQVIALVAKNPDVRFVFKEMPILSETSSHASVDQLASNKDNGKYLNVFGDLMQEKALDDDGVRRIMSQNGVDVARIDASAKSVADKHIAENKALAATIGVSGTPAFIVGDHVIAGWVPEELQAGIEQQRHQRGG